MMHKLESLSDYEEIRISSQEKLYSFTLGLCSYGISFFVKYENNYDNKKNVMLNNYDYRV